MIICHGLRRQLLLGDPNTGTTGCQAEEEYLPCCGRHHLSDAGVHTPGWRGTSSLRTARIPAYTPWIWASGLPWLPPLLGWVGVFLVCLFSSCCFCFILEVVLLGSAPPSHFRCVHLQAGAGAFPLSLLEAAVIAELFFRIIFKLCAPPRQLRPLTYQTVKLGFERGGRKSALL